MWSRDPPVDETDGAWTPAYEIDDAGRALVDPTKGTLRNRREMRVKRPRLTGARRTSGLDRPAGESAATEWTCASFARDVREGRHKQHGSYPRPTCTGGGDDVPCDQAVGHGRCSGAATASCSTPAPCPRARRSTCCACSSRRTSRPRGADHYIGLLWPTADEARGRMSLRTAVAQLRRALGPDAVRRSGDLSRLGDVESDVAPAPSRCRGRRAAPAPGAGRRGAPAGPGPRGVLRCRPGGLGRVVRGRLRVAGGAARAARPACCSTVREAAARLAHPRESLDLAQRAVRAARQRGARRVR